MDWYPQQVFTAEQAAAGAFLFKKLCLFRKGTVWGPQAMFTAGQAAADAFLFKRHAFLDKVRLYLIF